MVKLASVLSARTHRIVHKLIWRRETEDLQILQAWSYWSTRFVEVPPTQELILSALSLPICLARDWHVKESVLTFYRATVLLLPLLMLLLLLLLALLEMSSAGAAGAAGSAGAGSVAAVDVAGGG